LTITALPASEAATSLVRMFFDSNRRRIASATAAPSMMAPSTLAIVASRPPGIAARAVRVRSQHPSVLQPHRDPRLH